MQSQNVPRTLRSLALLAILSAIPASTDAPARAQYRSDQHVSAEASEQQRCAREPSHACVLTMFRALASTPGLLNADERESLETSIAVVDRPESLLDRGAATIDLGADWPPVDRILVNSLVARNRFAEAMALIDQWIDQFKRHDSPIVRDVQISALVHARTAIGCLRSSAADCAASLRAGFSAHAMHFTNYGTGESGPVTGSAYLKLDGLLAQLASRQRIDKFVEVLRQARLSPGELFEAIYSANPFETLAEVGLLRLAADGRWVDWRPLLAPFAEMLLDAWSRASDKEQADNLFPGTAAYLFWAHAVTGADMSALIALHGADPSRVSKPEQLCVLVSRSGLMNDAPQLRDYVQALIRDNAGDRTLHRGPTFDTNERQKTVFCDEDPERFVRASLNDKYASTHFDGSVQRLALEPRFPDSRVIPILDALLAEATAALATLGWHYDARGEGPGPREAIRTLLPLRAFRTGEIDVKTPLPDDVRPTLMAAQKTAIILGHLYRGDAAKAEESFRRLDPAQRLAFVTHLDLERSAMLGAELWNEYGALYSLPPADPAKLVALIAALDDGAEKARLFAAWLRTSMSRPQVIEDIH
jgi:hypothetical protein